MDNFEGITPAECRPLARRLIALAVHAERIQWPAGIVKDLRDAALVLEITAERAESPDLIDLAAQKAAQARHRAEPAVGIPTRMNDPAAHVDPFSTPREARYGYGPSPKAVLSDEAWGKESDGTDNV